MHWKSIVNVIAGFVGLYSLHIAALPKDSNHPYGHGKAEFLSAAIEGTLIFSAGALIIYNAVKNLIYPTVIHKLDQGIYLCGRYCCCQFHCRVYMPATGKRNNSLALVASGKHLLSDSYSTIGIISGLVIIFFTNKVGLIAQWRLFLEA
jgi:cation diffusion facilitator family transporter